MRIIDGKSYAKTLREELKSLLAKRNETLTLAVIIVGEDPASKLYVKKKVEACAEVGLASRVYPLPETTTQEELEGLIEKLSADNAINGILLQLPLPKGLDAKSAMQKIPPKKDVDGFTYENTGKLALNQESLVACTAAGIIKLLTFEQIPIQGKHAVILGRSDTVGKPLALLLLNRDATVTVCHSKTENLKEICKTADILISAIGKAKYVTADMVKEGAVVIDVGTNRDENGKLCGDIDFENVAPKTSYITPVPGGVGPMTIATLLYNVYTTLQDRSEE